MKSSLVALALLSSFTLAAQAAPNDGITGAYARVEVGRSQLSLPRASLQAGSDDRGQAVKVFGGFRFNENLGIEAGYAALGSFSARATVGGASVLQEGKARSIFGAATGRLPLGDSFALHGRLGLSSGKVSGTNVLSAGDDLMGSQTSAMFGAGAEYRPRPNVALTVDFDRYGKVSSKVKAQALLIGLHVML